MFITREVVYNVLEKGLESNENLVPNKLKRHQLTLNADIKLEEVCNGVIDPDTKETLTNYRKVIQSPVLRKIWTKAMSKEFGNIAQ